MHFCEHLPVSLLSFSAAAAAVIDLRVLSYYAVVGTASAL